LDSTSQWVGDTENASVQILESFIQSLRWFDSFPSGLCHLGGIVMLIAITPQSDWNSITKPAVHPMSLLLQGQTMERQML
jgi:hypothetical protein